MAFPLTLPVRCYRRGLVGTWGLLRISIYTRAHKKKYADVAVSEARSGRKMSKEALLGLIESIQSTVRKLVWKPAGTEWADYYAANNYTDAAFEHKKVLVGEWLSKIEAKTVWDLGANSGIFSRVAVETGAYVVSSDIDPAAVEVNYRLVKEKKEQNLFTVGA